MFNSIEEEINVMNQIVKEAVIHGGDAGGAYFSNDEGITNYLNIWLDKKELNGKFKVITAEVPSWGGDKVFECYPKIVPIDYNIYHPERHLGKNVIEWRF